MAEKNYQFAMKSSLRYSPQALAYLEAVEDVDMEKFEKWMIETLIIGGGNIMEFLMRKKGISVDQIKKDIEKNNLSKLNGSK